MNTTARSYLDELRAAAGAEEEYEGCDLEGEGAAAAAADAEVAERLRMDALEVRGRGSSCRHSDVWFGLLCRVVPCVLCAVWAVCHVLCGLEGEGGAAAADAEVADRLRMDALEVIFSHISCWTGLLCAVCAVSPVVL
jgi:hypothetical protein